MFTTTILHYLYYATAAFIRVYSNFSVVEVKIFFSNLLNMNQPFNSDMLVSIM